jgi:hypothetical protein
MTRCPMDEHALVERLKEWELDAHTMVENTRYKVNKPFYLGEEKAYGRVIDLIENGRVRQQHRALVPQGWSEVD